MNEYVLKFLEEKGYDNISQNYYKHIKKWKQWWKNEVEFHDYKDYFGIDRKMYSLGIAKRICEDWGSILWSDRDTIKTSKEENQVFVEKAIEEFDLENNIPWAVEISSYSGTCGSVVRIKDAVVSGKDNVITATENTTKELILVDAKHVIPLRKRHGKIKDVAFVSNAQVGDKDCIYIELHQEVDKGYKISNIYLDIKNGQEVENDAVLKEYLILSKIPLFSTLTPPKANPIKRNNGLGFSVYGDAIDQLKACDIAYHNYVMDIKLGGKKLIYNKSLVKYKQVRKKDGTIVDIPIS